MSQGAILPATDEPDSAPFRAAAREYGLYGSEQNYAVGLVNSTFVHASGRQGVTHRRHL